MSLKTKLPKAPMTFLHYIRTGEMFGYPQGCCLAFASDIIAGQNPFVLRGTIRPKFRPRMVRLDTNRFLVYQGSGLYVPCDKCKAKHAKELQCPLSKPFAGMCT